MVVASIGAIELNALKPYIIVLILLTIFGLIVTMVYLKYVCKKIYPTYEYEAYFSMFGMLTGTASTGMILLREIDSDFKTPAADNLVLQNVPAIMFGFPLMLLLVYAPLGGSQSWITLGILVIMFITLNIFILWNFIKKKPIAI
jgi:ESS family glutamate:Na+ symporter